MSFWVIKCTHLDNTGMKMRIVETMITDEHSQGKL